MSPPPSRDVSPEHANKTKSSLFGALNSTEFNLSTENASLKKEVEMLKDANVKLEQQLKE